MKLTTKQLTLCAVLTAVWTLGGKKRSDEKEG